MLMKIMYLLKKLIIFQHSKNHQYSYFVVTKILKFDYLFYKTYLLNPACCQLYMSENAIFWRTI